MTKETPISEESGRDEDKPLEDSLSPQVGSLDEQDSPEITDYQRRRSMVCACISAIAAVIGASCIVGNVLNLVAIKLGAGEIMLGLLAFAHTAPFIIGVFSLSAVEKLGKRKVLIGWLLASAFFVVPFLLLPIFLNVFSFSPLSCLYIILLATFLRTATTALGVAGWMPLLQDVVPNSETGRFFGWLRTAWQSAAFVFVMFLAFFLGSEPQWWRFEIIFALGLVMLLVRGLAVIPMTERLSVRRSETMRISKRLVELFRVRSLRTVAAYMFIYGASTCASLPFFVKLMKNLGFGDGLILAATSMFSLGAIISLRFWGKLADNFGNRSIFSLSHIGIMVALAGWVLVDRGTFGIVLTFVLYLLFGLFHAGNGIAQTRYLFHAIPDNRQSYIAMMNMISTLGAAIGPLLAGIFLFYCRDVNLRSGAIDMNNYHLLFVINTGLFLIPHFLRRHLRAEREKPTVEVITIITRPLRNILGPFVSLTPPEKNQELFTDQDTEENL